MSAFWKDIFREIKNTFGRFLSLLIITALGAASIIGIQATTIDMRAAADRHYKSLSLYDLQIKSTTGFDSDDLAALEAYDGVEAVMPTYLYDVFLLRAPEAAVVRTYALPDALNHVELLSGRLPQRADECAVEAGVLRYLNRAVGDTLQLGQDDMSEYDAVLGRDTFTIVGVVRSPLYLTHERGNTTIGDGALQYYLYLHPDAYRLDVYTDVYLSMRGSREMDNLTDGYYDALAGWKSQLLPLGKARTDSARQTLADAQREIDDGWAEYNSGVLELETSLTDGLRELADAKDKLDSGQQELDEKMAAARREMDSSARTLQSNQDTLDASRAALEQGLTQLEAAGPRGVSPALDAQYAALDARFAELDAAQAELDAGRQAISRARATLETERAQAQREIDDGWAEYHEGEQTLEIRIADARAELDEARVKLDDAQDRLDAAPEPEWFFFTRKDGVSYDSYYQDTQRLEKIGYVFPMVFFLVAIMVALTSMSRMVDERRTQIGLYKALGYRPAAIMLKYLTYSVLASFVGGVLGVCVGSVLFPRVISTAYGHLYTMPPMETPVPPVLGAAAIFLAMGAILAVTLLTCASALREAPSHLMRPKPPAAGRRVLLERVPFVWKRLSFTGKVTVRNIFRYKRRFFMTLVGIAGCSALLVTGFGLRDSVSGVTAMQFDRVVLYDSAAYLKEMTTSRQQDGLDALLPAQHLYLREEAVEAGGLSAHVVVPERTEGLGDFIGLRVPLGDDGALVTEKLARVLGVSVGDRFDMTTGDGRVYSAVVAGITENYISHYIYLSPAAYTRTFGAPAYPNAVWVLTGDQTALASELLGNENVRAVIHTSELRTRVGDATDALGIVTVLLIALACALALIVLFNLTNINISERIRELATIKVLGFFNNEVSMYVYRENAVVTVLGIAAGMVGGIFLHRFVLVSAEIDYLMFPHIILPQSYLLSATLSVLFAVFVNLVMNVRLARINMVESLKNVE